MTDRQRDPEEDALAALVRASLAGDHDAFRQIVERKRDLVHRVAYSHLGNADDARTVAQAVFIRLWKSLDRYDPTRRFDTWLYQVTVNASIDHHRRRKVRALESPLDESLAAAPTQRDALESAEIQRILVEISTQLTEKQRTAFVLREVEGLATSAVAVIMGSTESTIRNHVFQARKVLRDELSRRYPEYVPHARDVHDANVRERS